jgi:hypothetical protein
MSKKYKKMANPKKDTPESSLPEVSFHKKADWQKNNCIRPNCTNISTLEARCGAGKKSSAIRCCANDACKQFAKDLALKWVQQNLK